MMLLTMLQPIVTHQLQVEKIESNNGYTIIQQDQILIPETFNYSLHVIDLNQIEEIINQLTISVSLLPKNLTYPLLKSINNLNIKLTTLGNGHHTINKRGLINFLGTISKWITGTMDDEDRQLINNHLNSIDNNNLNIIKNINNQIKINDNFNKSINKLVDVIEEDRKIISDFLKIESDTNKVKITTLDIKLNIQEVDRMISELQDNIILTNLNIIHPSLLTHEEILDYQINSDKIKNLKAGFSKTTTNKLIFLIKIPHKMITINKKLIIPISNINTCNVIDAPITPTLEYHGTFFEYNINKPIYQLQKLNHCIVNKFCKNLERCNTEIYNIDDGSILIQLANDIKLTSDCDERKFTLQGNYFVKFYNCTITLGNNTYYNNIKEITNKYIVPNLDYKPENNKLKFNEINLTSENNTEEIKEIKFNKIIIYSSICTTSVIASIIILCFIYFYFKNKCFKRIQENPQSNEGRVICEHKHTTGLTESADPYKIILL